MGVVVRYGGVRVRMDGNTWETVSGDERKAETVVDLFQAATKGYSPLPWDPAGVEHVRQILGDYGGEIVEGEPIDEADSVENRVY